MFEISYTAGGNQNPISSSLAQIETDSQFQKYFLSKKKKMNPKMKQKSLSWKSKARDIGDDQDVEMGMEEYEDDDDDDEEEECLVNVDEGDDDEEDDRSPEIKSQFYQNTSDDFEIPSSQVQKLHAVPGFSDPTEASTSNNRSSKNHVLPDIPPTHSESSSSNSSGISPSGSSKSSHSTPIAHSTKKRVLAFGDPANNNQSIIMNFSSSSSRCNSNSASKYNDQVFDVQGDESEEDVLVVLEKSKQSDRKEKGSSRSSQQSSQEISKSHSSQSSENMPSKNSTPEKGRKVISTVRFPIFIFSYRVPALFS